jgi:hypothetical protein
VLEKIGTVAYIYNPSYSGGSDQEDQVQGQLKVSEIPSQSTSRCDNVHL